jgi:hypothetical protein
VAGANGTIGGFKQFNRQGQCCAHRLRRHLQPPLSDVQADDFYDITSDATRRILFSSRRAERCI